MATSRLPSLRGLQAFEAVASAGNLAEAADRLGITPSAVSHRVRGLEKELGLELLRRTSRGLALTQAGRRYQAGVSEAFALLAKATQELAGPDLSRPLTISITTEFGVRWLMPRFHRFREAHPEVDTAILSTFEVADLAAGEADIALRHGEGRWPGVIAEPILDFEISPVCAPALLPSLEGLSPGEAISRATVIRQFYDDWDAWLEAAGLTGTRPAREMWFTDYSMAITTAMAGDGLTLGYFSYLEDEISSGKLVQPFPLTVSLARGYYLVYPENRLADPRARAFRDWVINEQRRARGATPNGEDKPVQE